MPEFAEYSVPSEGELWRLLESILEHPDHYTGPPRFRLDSWRPELLYLPDEPIGHTVSPALARAITEFHRSLGRSYAYVAYGQANATLLRNDDRHHLDVRFHITDGSNGVELIELTGLADGLIEKMTGEQITLIVVVYFLLFFGHSFARNWIEKHYEQKRRDREAREREKTSEEETRRAQIMADALARYPHLRPISDAADDSKVALVTAAQSVTRSRVMGTDLTAEEAKVLTSRPREPKDGQRLDGQFELVNIVIEHDEGFVARLRKIDTDQEFNAELNWSELPAQDIDAVFQAGKVKRPINAYVNAWFVGERIERASLVRVVTESDGG